MATTVTIDLRQVARGLSIPLRQIQAVVELLDEGNTVPFITRYRKDQTGGLDEEQVRQIQTRLAKARLLADRKQTILRSIDAQGKLTEELTKQILAANTAKRLEDLYLPYKPKKQTLATLARSRGLELLAGEILSGDPACADMDARAADFVNPEREVFSAADALLGAGHILAEQFSERADLRQRLREILLRTGRFVTTRVGGDRNETTTTDESVRAAKADRAAGAEPAADPAAEVGAGREASGGPAEADGREPEAARPAAASAAPAEGGGPENPGPAAGSNPGPRNVASDDQGAGQADRAPSEPPAPEQTAPPADGPDRPAASPESPDSAPGAEQATGVPGTETAEASPGPQSPEIAPVAPRTATARRQAPRKPTRLTKRELKKKRAEEKKIKAFRDYFDYREEIRKIPPHRLLAINRGERAKVLRVRIESDAEAMGAALQELLVPSDHAHADYLRGCAQDALDRLISPSLEREIRRDLTDRAEAHAVGVFAKNLRNLLLQPPVRERRVLAVDPGFKSGCKLAALDQFGNVLGDGLIYLVGRAERRQQARQKVVELIDQFQLSLVAIGNGTACRQTEDFFAELLAEELQGRDIAYVIVNEAGASVYSTSRIGREEFPNYDASLRGAISIGRRLLDPLSELVKIDAANIGVGLYQHDVKAKHLRTSLDQVVESCVNYVGVDVNTASPALLRYVSGLNQLTAQRLYEHRGQIGPFRSREQLREVAGFGEATFVQAAGFLKISGGDNPLDATWIHPESYDVAGKVLARLDRQPEDLRDREKLAAVARSVPELDAEALANDLSVGTLTLKDILAQLARPGRDPREDLPAPVFKRGVLKLEDLSPGMELTGTVLNVVDFGAFLDIGMHDSGLVHVSQLADRYVRDPHEVVAVGDIVKVWVLAIDKERRRVSLTMIPPGTQRSRRGRRGARREADAADHEQGKAGRAPPRHKPKGPAKHRGGPGRKGPPKVKGPPKPRHRPKPPPKPVIPITEAMKAGKEPMRTFGDLAQFFQHKQEAEDRGGDREEAPGTAGEAPGPSQKDQRTEDQPPSAPAGMEGTQEETEETKHQAQPPQETPEDRTETPDAPQ